MVTPSTTADKDVTIQLPKEWLNLDNIIDIKIAGLNPDTVYVMTLTCESMPTQQECYQLSKLSDLFKRSGITLIPLFRPKQTEVEIEEIQAVREALEKAEKSLRT